MFIPWFLVQKFITNQFGRAEFEPPSHHPEDDDNAGDKHSTTAVSHPTKIEVDNLATVQQRLFGEVVLDKPSL